jgi:hypothetical protein
MAVIDWVISLLSWGLSIINKFTDWFKCEIPIEFGFLLNDKIVSELSIPVGHPIEPIIFRFRNHKRITLTGVSYEIRIYRPLKLSSTGQAIRYTNIIGDKLMHGPSEENKCYWIHQSKLDIGGHRAVNLRVELNTGNITPGTYRIEIDCHTTLREYKYKRETLSLKIG